MFAKFEKFGPVATVGISLYLVLRVILTGILLLRLGAGARLRFLTFIPWLFLRPGLGSCTICRRDTLIVVVSLVVLLEVVCSWGNTEKDDAGY